MADYGGGDHSVWYGEDICGLLDFRGAYIRVMLRNGHQMFRFWGPAVVRQPTADDHCDETNEKRQNDVYLGIA